MNNVDICYDAAMDAVIISYNPTTFNFGWHGDFPHYLYRLNKAIETFNRKLNSQVLTLKSDDDFNIVLTVESNYLSIKNTEYYAVISFRENGCDYKLNLFFDEGNLVFDVNYNETYRLFR